MSNKTQAKWDFSRFLTTLNYFGEIPFIGSFRWLQQWLGQSDSFPGITLNAMKKKIVVVGAVPSSSSGSKSLDSELAKLLQQKLGESADFVWSKWPCQAPQGVRQDELQEPTDTFREPSEKIPSKLANLVRSVDTVILLDADNALSWIANEVDYKQASEVVTQSVFEFSNSQSDLSAWGSLDDVVMGGMSQGSIFKRGSKAVFAGNVSTENSGGFSSVRTKNFEPPFDFSGWHGIQLRIKGDGQRYKFIARNSGGWDSPAYIYGVDTVKDEWVDVRVPFESMVPTFRARSVSDAPKFHPGQVFSFQLMLSKFEYDRQLNPSFEPGAFELLISSISVYRPRKGVPVIVVGSSDGAICAQQQVALKNVSIDCRFVEPPTSQSDSKALSDAIAQALTK